MDQYSTHDDTKAWMHACMFMLLIQMNMM